MQGRKHVLVVEDDPLVAEIVTEALGEEFETSLAGTAAAGAERIRQGGVDLLLLDCTLPGGLGRDLLDLADAGSVQVLLMSGNPALAAEIPGRRPFILKPFSLSGLVDAVRTHIGGK